MRWHMNGDGNAIQKVIADWAAANPKVRRVWVLRRDTKDGEVDIAVELQPVADSEETFALWVADGEAWRSQLQARTGRSVNLEWVDPDKGPVQTDKVLVYEH